MATVLFQRPLGREYTELTDAAVLARIADARAALGNDVVILGHHYQREDIIRFADYRGDSFKLARLAAAGNEPIRSERRAARGRVRRPFSVCFPRRRCAT